MPSPGGYKGRLLDLLNGAPPFIAVTGALVHRRCQKDEEEPVEYDVLLLCKDEIQFVVPLD